jgi:hypothetical protein
MALKVSGQKQLSDWKKRVTALLNQIQDWATEFGWSIDPIEKHVAESLLGEYTLPALHIRTPDGELYVTPVALHVIGADGRVDIEAWPSLNRVKLIGVGAPPKWEIMTDSNVPLRESWTRRAFLKLVKDLQS